MVKNLHLHNGMVLLYGYVMVDEQIVYSFKKLFIHSK